MFDALTDPAEAHWQTVSALTAVAPDHASARLRRLRTVIGELLVRAGGSLLPDGEPSCTQT